MNGMQSLLALVGRLFLALIFISSMFSKLTNWEGSIRYMESHGMPMVNLALLAAVLGEGLGGISVLIGYKTRLGALVLVSFLVPASLIFHAYWDLEGQEAGTQQIMFMKNLAIIGGLCMVMAFGAGRISVDARGTPKQC